MSAYTLEDERAIRTGRLVEDWTRSGLLTAGQRDIVMPQLAVELRRTNLFLRITLFLFGGVILQSALGLMAIFFGGMADATGMAALCIVAGAGCFWLSAHLVRRYHLYRFGVEEVVALSAAGLVAVGGTLLVVNDSELAAVVGLTLAAATLAALYVHFGYVYAALLAMAAAAALPFQLGDNEIIQRAVAIVVLAATAVWVRRARAPHGNEYPGDALAVIEAAAWLGIYLLINLVVSSGITRVDRTATFYWITYLAIWVVPATGLIVALRGRERPLLLVSMAMALTTLLSNKEYLGSPRYEWDPIVFGLVLMGVAVVVRRWLASGEGGLRHGYTASRLVASDKSPLGHLAVVSATHAGVPVAESTPSSGPAIGGGGRAGGAGAGGSF